MRILAVIWICLLVFGASGQGPSLSAHQKIKNLFDQLDKSKDIEHGDSLATMAIELAKNLNNDSLVGEALFQKALLYHRKRDYKKSMPLWSDALSAFTTNKNANRAVRSINMLAWSLLQFERYDEADSLYQLAINLNENFELSSKSKYRLYQGLANVKGTQRKFDKSIEYYLKAQDFLDQNNQGSVSQYHANLGNTYSALQRFDEAKSHLRKAVKAALNVGEGTELYALKMLGAIAFDFHEYDSAIHFFDAAIQGAIKRGDQLQEGYININKSRTYLQQNNLKKAGESAMRASDLLRDNTSPNQLAQLKITIGDYHIERKEFTQAIHVCEQALELVHHIENPIIYQGACRCLIQANRAIGRHEIALNYYDLRAVSVDSSNFQHLERKIAQAESEYAIQTEKAAMELQAKETESAYQLNLLKEKNTRNLLLVGLFALGLISAFLIKSNRKKKKYNRVLNDKNQIIATALEEKDLLLREIHHRVKNNLQIISSLLSLQSRQIEDEDIKQAINEGRSRVRSMALIHQNLYRQENLTGIHVNDYIKSLLTELFGTFKIDPKRITLQLNIEEIELDVEDMVPIGLIINELVTNSLKYAFPDQRSGRLYLSLQEKDNTLKLTVSDDGIGMKPEDLNKQHSFGTRMVKAFLNKMEGTIAYSFSGGTQVDIVFHDYKSAA